MKKCSAAPAQENMSRSATAESVEKVRSATSSSTPSQCRATWHATMPPIDSPCTAMRVAPSSFLTCRTSASASRITAIGLGDPAPPTPTKQEADVNTGGRAAGRRQAMGGWRGADLCFVRIPGS